MPLRGLYMQGWEGFRGQKITTEMSAIAKEENIPLYINNYGKITKDESKSLPCFYDSFSIWAQDTKNFLCNGKEKILLCNDRDAVIKRENLGDLCDYNIISRPHLPRGGNFFIGYKPNGERYIIVSAKTTINNPKSLYDSDSSIQQHKGLYNNYELVTLHEISQKFNVEMENIYLLDTAYEDLDMLIRPIGYPYVLVNDCDETYRNMEKLQEKNPYNKKQITHHEMYGYAYMYKRQCRDIQESLRKMGFEPIEIGGNYFYNINFLNAIAFRNKNGGISYITNSVRDSGPEWEGLEEIFENDLRASVDNIENVYFVSGGNARENGFPYSARPDVNAMMYWLGENRGGIHCMTAEIPDFDVIA